MNTHWIKTEKHWICFSKAWGMSPPPKKIAPSPGQPCSWLTNTWFLGHTQVHKPNLGTSISPAASAALTVVTNRQTDRQTDTYTQTRGRYAVLQQSLHFLCVNVDNSRLIYSAQSNALYTLVKREKKSFQVAVTTVSGTWRISQVVW